MKFIVSPWKSYLSQKTLIQFIFVVYEVYILIYLPQVSLLNKIICHFTLGKNMQQLRIHKCARIWAFY